MSSKGIRNGLAWQGESRDITTKTKSRDFYIKLFFTSNLINTGSYVVKRGCWRRYFRRMG